MRMTFLILLLSIALAFEAQAVQVRIVGKNSTTVFESEVTAQFPTNVGNLSIEAFDAGGVPYEGGASGVSKIFDMGQDIEIISDWEMKAYGWCFSIDGLVPDTMADTTPVTNQESIIQWFYAYAHYDRDNWIAQCVAHDSN
jgi:hypothetical protein